MNSKKCPPGKIVNPNTNRCIKKPCPPGKIVNPKTNRCIKKPCPLGKYRNLTTGRCKKGKANPKIINSIQKKTYLALINSMPTTFMTLKNKTFDCNLLLIKIKSSYFIKRKDNSIIKITKKSKLLTNLENTLATAGNKLCTFTVENQYIKDSYNDCDISIVLFSETYHEKSRSKEPTYLICGLLFLNENSANVLYLNLICAKSVGGLGSKLLGLAEHIGKYLKYKKLRLTSIDEPLGFYIHKGYTLEIGNDVYKIPEKIDLKYLKRNSNGTFTKKKELIKHGVVKDNVGHTRHVKQLDVFIGNNNTRNSRLRSKTNLISRITHLYGIKKDDDGVYMFKRL